jgi:hypothetical protein
VKACNAHTHDTSASGRRAFTSMGAAQTLISEMELTSTCVCPLTLPSSIIHLVPGRRSREALGLHARWQTTNRHGERGKTRITTSAARVRACVAGAHLLLSGRPSSVMSCHLQKSEVSSKSWAPTRLPTMCTNHAKMTCHASCAAALRTAGTQHLQATFRHGT